MNKSTPLLLAAVLLAATTSIAAAAERDLSCSLAFTSSEWSALYASAVGEGTVTCTDGSSMPVVIRARGLGITAGRWKITDGKGRFSHVARIDDVLGSYLAVSGDIGVSKAGTARALTKGKVSLVLAGKGEGFDVGIAVSKFRIGKPGTESTRHPSEAHKPVGKTN